MRDSRQELKMDYCNIDDVKGVLQIDLAETKYDSQLADCIISGSALVDGFLKPKNWLFLLWFLSLSRMLPSFLPPGCLGALAIPRAQRPSGLKLTDSWMLNIEAESRSLCGEQPND